MGSMISMFATAGVIMFMLIVYLLSKVIIEKEQPVYFYDKRYWVTTTGK